MFWLSNTPRPFTVWTTQLYGRLSESGQDIMGLLPPTAGFRLIDSRGQIGALSVLFVGVKPLRQFGYEEIREFGRKVLVSLAGAKPKTRHLCLTIHGPG